MEKKLIDFEVLCENCDYRYMHQVGNLNCGNRDNKSGRTIQADCPIWQGLESVPDITARVLLKDVLKSRESMIYFLAEFLYDTPDIDKIIKKVERERG